MSDTNDKHRADFLKRMQAAQNTLNQMPSYGALMGGSGVSTGIATTNNTYPSWADYRETMIQQLQQALQNHQLDIANQRAEINDAKAELGKYHRLVNFLQHVHPEIVDEFETWLKVKARLEIEE